MLLIARSRQLILVVHPRLVTTSRRATSNPPLITNKQKPSHQHEETTKRLSHHYWSAMLASLTGGPDWFAVGKSFGSWQLAAPSTYNLQLCQLQLITEGWLINLSAKLMLLIAVASYLTDCEDTTLDTTYCRLWAQCDLSQASAIGAPGHIWICDHIGADSELPGVISPLTTVDQILVI
ncbi:hypothetical protein J6590_047513 [Homalodisca vitripennis]|nr:hypothetical protein J6590_047513 [Homalodisca vitripennis]